ncbi:MAG: hypothetical protein ACTTI1_03945 [Prevotella intermedia]
MNGFLFIKQQRRSAQTHSSFQIENTFRFPTPFLSTYLYFDKKAPEKCKYSSQAYLLCNHLVINALQNLLFCVPKAAVLHGKSVGFASQKSRFRNAKAQLSLFKEIIFTKLRIFLSSGTSNKRENCLPNKVLLILYLYTSFTGFSPLL